MAIFCNSVLLHHSRLGCRVTMNQVRHEITQTWLSNNIVKTKNQLSLGASWAWMSKASSSKRGVSVDKAKDEA